MVEGLIDFTEECSRDDATRVMVITGNGRAFSSGDDIVEGMGEVPARHSAPGGLRADLGLHHEMVQKLLSIPKPVVVAINGRCHGAGWVIALACDFRVARADEEFGLLTARRVRHRRPPSWRPEIADNMNRAKIP